MYRFPTPEQKFAEAHRLARDPHIVVAEGAGYALSLSPPWLLGAVHRIQERTDPAV